MLAVLRIIVIALAVAAIVAAPVAVERWRKQPEPAPEFVASAVVALDEATWAAKVERAGVPVLVVFSAAWCGPCRSYAPAVEAAATQLAGVALVGKVDADRSPGLTRRYGVGALPTTALFVGGVEAARFTGGRSSQAVVAFVRKHAH